MDQATLVGPDINAGLDAVVALDAAALKPVVAMLAVLPEYEDWRLILSSPSLDQTHLLKAYNQVTAVLRGRFVDTLPPIMIFPTKDPFIRELRRIFGKAKDVAGMRMGGQKIGNRFIESAYVYRVQ
jgi:hypothetical protein